MMTKEEINARISEILKDERLHYKTANIRINAPLALIQLSLETEVHTLQTVLGVELTNFKSIRHE